MTRPTKLADIVGQESAKTVLNVLLKASQIRNEAIPHCFFSGPPGNGKTTMAQCLAAEKGVKCHIMNAANLNKIKDLEGILINIKDSEIIFIDEIHSLPSSVCEYLYTVMEDFVYYKKVGGYVQPIKLPKFTVIGASTCIGKLPQPMKDRFKFIAELVEYTQEELCQIVEMVCKSYGFKLNQAISNVIAKTCRNTPRIVVSRTEWIRDYMLANNLKSIKTKDVIEIIKLQGIDEHGFDKQDHRYLNIIKEHGPISIGQIASKMNADKNTIINDVEPFLIKNGLIHISTTGRVYAGK